MLPPLLTQAQYEARVKRTLGVLDAAQFQAFSEDASALVRQVAEQDFLDGEEPPGPDVPGGIIPVMFRVVDRAMENRLALGMEVDGSYTAQKAGLRGGDGGVYLTDQDEADIRRALDPPETGFVAVTMSNFPLPGAS